MTKYWALVKILLMQQFRRKSNTQQKTVNGKKKSGKGGMIALIILCCVGFLPLASMLVVAAYFAGMAHAGIVIGDVKYSLALIMLIIQGLLLVFALPTLISGVFSPKDGGKLLYLPVSTSTLFAGKMTIVYFNEVLTSLLFTMILLLPFGIGAGLGLSFYLLLLPAILLMPMLPLTIACIVALPLSIVSRKLSKIPFANALMGIIVFVAIMGLYLYGIMALGEFMDNMDAVTGQMSPEEFTQYITNMVNGFIDSIRNVVPYALPNYLMGTAMVGIAVSGVLLTFVGALALDIVLLALTILLSITTFRKNMRAMLETSGKKKVRKNAKAYIYGTKGIVPTMVLTNLKRYLRDKNIGVQIVLSLVMPVFIVLVFGFSFSMGAEAESGEMVNFMSDPLINIIASVVLFGYMTMLCGSSNILSTYPISIDKNNLYMMKIIPVAISKILLSKVILSTSLIAISSLLTSVIAIFALNISWYSALLMSVAMTVYQFGTMCITTYLDIKKPNLNWENYNSGLKHAKNSMISLLCGFLIMLAIGICGTLFIIWYISADYLLIIELLMWIAIIAVGVGYSAISYTHLTSRGKIAFDKLEI